MIEIVCPSCEARYRLPDGAIGESGRKVSCSACGHGWVAHPEPEEAPLDLGAAAVETTAAQPERAPEPELRREPEPATADAAPRPQPQPEPAVAAAAAGAAATSKSGHGSEMGGGRPAVKPLPGQGKTFNPYAAYDDDETTSGASPYADEEDRGMAAYEAFAKAQRDDDDEDDDEDDDFAARTGHSIEKLAGDRAQQMEQIKSLLNEIKETPATTFTPAEEDDEEEEYRAEQAARPSALERTLIEMEEEDRDPLRAKLEDYGKPKKTGDVKVTRNKMLKKHAKKVRRRKMEDAKGSGTFTTGMLLVVMILAIMVSIYLLSDILIEKVPEAEPAIRDYVATMDQFRIWAGEQIAAFQAWMETLVEK